jgi:hypothetical protein
VNPLVLAAFRVKGPVLQGDQLENEARTTFLCAINNSSSLLLKANEVEQPEQQFYNGSIGSCEGDMADM